MLKRVLVLMVLLAPWLGGASCDGADKFRNSKNFVGVIELGPFPKQGPTVGGYTFIWLKTGWALRKGQRPAGAGL